MQTSGSIARTAWGLRVCPYATAAAFPLSMWLGNLSEEPGPGAVAATFALALGLAAGADLALRRAVRDGACRSLLASAWAVCALGYGHAFALLAPVRPAHRWMLPAWLGAFAAAGLAAWLGRRARFVTGAARLAAAASLCFVAVQLGWALPALKARVTPQARASAPDARAVAAGTRVNPAAAGGSGAARPDVYYVILDGYARADVLREVHGFDNRPFVAALRARGFYVADRARSNYAQTRLSLPSSLSMDYLPPLPEDDAYELHHRQLRRLYKESRVAARLRQLGYRYRYVGSVFWPDNPDADEVLFPRGRDGGYFRAFLATTVFEPVCKRLRLLDPAANRMAVDEYQWASIARPKAVAGPMFVFAHVVLPHGPYYYGREGPRPDPVQEEDGTSRDYVEQVQYVNRRVLELIDAIDRTSGPEAVVLFQADHGSDILGLPSRPTSEQLFERMSILSAFRAPERVRERLYPSITPVNSFRAVLGGLFGDDLPMLEDRSYYSSYDAPLRLIEAP